MGKRSKGRPHHRHTQLSEHLQRSEAWATLKGNPRALYTELKRRFNGRNNGEIVLSYRDAAKAICVNRNTVGGYFKELEERGFIAMTKGHCLGPSGVGQAAHWALQELPVDGKPAQMGYEKWRKKI